MRHDRLNWPDHHMLIALVTAQRSADPNTQVGACIVNQKNRVLGVGYNGPPRGVAPAQIPWARKDDDPLNTKYPYIVHAEKNAIYNASESVAGSTLYVTMYPCNECAKDIIQAGIREVFYLTNPYVDEWFTRAAERMFQIVDIPCKQHEWDENRVWSCFQSITLSIAGTPGGSNLDGTLHRCARDPSKSGNDQRDLRGEIPRDRCGEQVIRPKTEVPKPE